MISAADDAQTLSAERTAQLENGDLDIPDNVILPPPEIRAFVDNTAKYVAKNGVQFEEKIRERERDNPKFCFLNTQDPYYPYYSCQLIRFKAGVVQPQEEAEDDASVHEMAHVLPLIKPIPMAPPPFEFCVDVPTVSVQDSDIIKLTAQFVARNGRQFMNQLSQREARNYQFDFLRPSHSLFGYFTKLVEQYTKPLSQPRELATKLYLNIHNRQQILRRVQQRVEYARWEEEQIQKMAAEEDAERVVQVIDITEADERAELPQPTTLLELQNMSIIEKRQVFVPLPATDQVEENDDDGMDMDMDMEVEAPIAIVKSVPTSVTSTVIPQPKAIGPMKIRTDYIAGQRRAQKNSSEVTTICSVCKQSIPVSEIEEHVRIELLDPKWREQRESALAARSETNLSREGTHIAQSLTKFAEYRPDLFGSDDADPQKKLQEDQAKQKELAKKKVVWDGHTNSTAAVIQQAQQAVPMDEQIAAIHRNKGLIQDASKLNIGPQVAQPLPESSMMNNGGNGIPPPMPIGMNSVSGMMNGIAFPHAGFNHNSFMPPPPPPHLLPPGMMPNQMGFVFPPSQPSPMSTQFSGYHNEREGIMSDHHPSDVNQIRLASMMDEEGGPDTKKVKTDTFMAEDEWIQRHPNLVSLTIITPDAPDKHPDLIGKDVHLKDLNPMLTISQLKDQLAARINLPASRQKLTITTALGQNVVTKNNLTLAYYNLLNSSIVVLGVRERGGKR